MQKGVSRLISKGRSRRRQAEGHRRGVLKAKAVATLCYRYPSTKRHAVLGKGTWGPLFGGAKDWDDDVFLLGDMLDRALLAHFVFARVGRRRSLDQSTGGSKQTTATYALK